MLHRLYRFFGLNEAKNQSRSLDIHQNDDQDLEELQGITDFKKLYNRIADDFNLAKKALKISEYLNMLTGHHAYLTDDNFLLPLDGKAQSRDSALAYLCRYNPEVAVFVLTDKELSPLLHDLDISNVLCHTEAKLEINRIVTERNLLDQCDERYQQLFGESYRVMVVSPRPR